jgi:hypothetical protein
MILERVLQDAELQSMYKPRQQEYFDPEYHLLVQDIVYSARYFHAPELLQEEEKPVEIKKFTLEAQKGKVKLQGVHVDYKEEAESRKKLGDAGETFVYQLQRANVKKYKLGKGKKVRMVSKLDGDGLGYDILSYDENGKPMYIEVKTTAGSEDESIFITANELEWSETHSEQYYLYRVYEFDLAKMEGKISVRRGSLRPLCIFAQTYKVHFT